MAQTPSELAAAIRRSLQKIYSLSDEELAGRDARAHALFQGIAREAVFSRKGAMAFEQLATLILGAPLAHVG